MGEALDRAVAFHKQGRLDMAESEYLNALSEDLDNHNILYLLGTVYLQQKKYGLSTQLLLRAIQMKQDHFESWNNLGNCYKAVNREVDARICWEKNLTIAGRGDNDYADIYNNLATLYVNSGMPEDGVGFALKSIELNPVHPDAHWNLGLMYLEQGMYKEGFELYKWGFKTKYRPYRNYGDKAVDWKGEEGKTIVVWGEQGIGDEIMFSSILPELQEVSKKVIFDCHPRLVNLFKESFPGIHVYGTRKDDSISWLHDHPDIDAKIAIADLGQYFRKDVKHFPKHNGYLKANEERRKHYKAKLAKLGNKKKVGISWLGGALKTRRDYRSIPLEKWMPILKNDYEFISLQYTPEAYNTVSDMEDKFDIKIHHWPSAVQNADYMETAALVAELDLVITVNTAIHHLAGGLGKECWTLTPKAKAWRYFSPSISKRDIPWYPSVRQWQQKEPMVWDGLIDNVALALKDKW